MSSIDERVVELQFNNGQFESGVQQSIGTLDKLKKSLNLQASADSLSGLQKAGKNFDLSNVSNNIQTVADRCSTLGVVGAKALEMMTEKAVNFGHKLLTAIPNQIISGGTARAMKIEAAKFKMEGLLGAEEFEKQWENINNIIDKSVQGTAYGYDAAASVAAQLKASNIDFGDEMLHSLQGIAGGAAMTGSSFEEIGHIFTTIAGQGKVMTMQLQQFANRGLNVAATLADYLKVDEATLREMVTKGKVSFEQFSEAMYKAFGDQATKANKTFDGAFSNIKASLSRMGAQFAGPAYEAIRKFFVGPDINETTGLLRVLKDLEKILKPLSDQFSVFAENTTASLNKVLDSIHAALEPYAKLGQTVHEAFEKSKKALDVSKEQADTTEKTDILLKKTTKDQDKYQKALKVGTVLTTKSTKEAEGLKKELQALGFAYKDLGNGEIEIVAKGSVLNNLWGDMTNTAENVKEAISERFPILSNLLGLEKEEVETANAIAKEYEGLDELAQDVLLGKYGNGEARKKALEELGLSYAIIQNRVNELCGVEKRYEVTAEDEAKMAKYLSKTNTETAESTEKAITTAERGIIVLGGIGSSLKLVARIASSLWKNILAPFGKWAGMTVLNGILTILTPISKKIVALEQTLPDDFFDKKFKGFADFFRNIGKNFSDFLKQVQNLESVKALGESFTKLGEAITNFFNSGFTAISGIFEDIGDAAEKGIDFQWAVDIIDDLAEVLGKAVDAITEGVNAAWPILEDFGTSLHNLFTIIQESEATKKLIETFGNLRESVGKFIGAGFDAVTNFFKSLGGSSEESGHKLDWFAKIVEGVNNALIWFGEKVKWVTDTISNFISTKFTSENFTKFKDSITEFITKVQNSQPIQDLMQAFTDLATSIEKLFTPGKSIDNVTRSIGSAGEAAEEAEPKFGWLLKIIEGLAQILTVIVGWADSGIQKLIEFFSSEENVAILDKLAQTFTNLKEAISGVLGLAFDNVIAFFTGLGKSGKEVKEGTDLTESISIFEKVANAIMFVVGSITELLNLIVANGGSLAAAFTAWFDGVDFTKIWTDFKTNLVSAFASIFGGGDATDSETTKVGEAVVDATAEAVEEKAKTLPQVIAEKLVVLPGQIASSIRDLIAKVKTSDMLKSIKNIGIGVGGIAIGKFFINIGKGLKNFAKIPGKVIKSLDGLQGVLKGYERNLNATALLKCAFAIGILVASLWLLSKINPGELGKVLGVLAPLAIGIGVLIYALEKLKQANKLAEDAKGLTKLVNPLGQFADAVRGFLGKLALGINVALIVGSLLLIVKAIATLSETPFGKLLSGAIKLALVGALLYAFVKVVNKMSAEIKPATAAGLFLLAAAITALSAAVFILGNMKIGTLLKGGLAVAGLIVAIAYAAKVAGPEAGNMASFGSGAILLAVGLTALAVPILLYSRINFGTIISSLIKFAIILGPLALAAHYASPAIYKLGLAMVSISKAMLRMALAVVVFAAGVALIGVAVDIFVRAMVDLGDVVLNNIGKAAAGLGAFSAVILVLAGLGKICGAGLAELGVGLMFIAGACLIFAAAIALLVGLSPMIKGFVEGTLSSFGELVKGIPVIGDAFEKFFGETDKGLKEFSKSLDEIGIDTDLKDDLVSKFTELQNLSGKDFAIGINDLIAEINGLDITDEEKQRIIKDYLDGLTISATEDYTVYVNNLKATVGSFAKDGVSFSKLGFAQLYSSITHLLDFTGDDDNFYLMLGDVEANVNNFPLSGTAKGKVLESLKKLQNKDLSPEERKIELERVLLYINGLDYQGEAQAAVQKAFDDVVNAEGADQLGIKIKDAKALIDQLHLPGDRIKSLNALLDIAANEVDPAKRKIILDSAFLEITRLDFDAEGQKKFVEDMLDLTGLSDEELKKAWDERRKELEDAGWTEQMIQAAFSSIESAQKELGKILQVKTVGTEEYIDSIAPDNEELQSKLKERFAEIRKALESGNVSEASELMGMFKADLFTNAEFSDLSPEEKSTLGEYAAEYISAAQEAIRVAIEGETSKESLSSFIVGNNLFGILPGTVLEYPIAVELTNDGNVTKKEFDKIIDNIVNAYSPQDLVNSFQALGMDINTIIDILFPDVRGVEGKGTLYEKLSALSMADLNREGMFRLFFGDTSSYEEAGEEAVAEISGAIAEGIESADSSNVDLSRAKEKVGKIIQDLFSSESIMKRTDDGDTSEAEETAKKAGGKDAEQIVDSYIEAFDEQLRSLTGGHYSASMSVLDLFDGIEGIDLTNEDTIKKLFPDLESQDGAEIDLGTLYVKDMDLEGFHEVLSKSVEDSASDVKDAYETLGDNSVDGYTESIEAGKGEVEDKTAGLMRWGIDSSANEIRAHSPSEAYKELGRYSVEGYALGLTENQGLVTDAVNTVFGNAIKELAGDDPEKLETTANGLDAITEALVGLTEETESGGNGMSVLSMLAGNGAFGSSLSNLSTASDLLLGLCSGIEELDSSDTEAIDTMLTTLLEGSGSSNVPKLMNDTADALEKLRKQLNSLKDDPISIKDSLGPMADDLAAIGLVLKPVALNLAEAGLGLYSMSYAMTSFIDTFSNVDAIENFTENIPKMKDAIQETLNMLVELAPDVGKFVVGFINGLFDAWSDEALINGLVSRITVFVFQIIEGIAVSISEHSDKILAVVNTICLSVLDLVFALVGELVEGVPVVGEVWGHQIEVVRGHIKDMLSEENGREDAKDYIDGLADSIIDGFDNATEVIEAGASGKGFKAGSVLENLFFGQNGNFKNTMEEIQKQLESGELNVDKIMEGIIPPEGVSPEELKNYLFPDGALDPNAMLTFLADSGLYIVQGLETGINENTGLVRTAIDNMANNDVKEPFTNSLGIESPSTVFQGYGRNIDQGLANGIKNGSVTVSSAIRTLAVQSLNAFLKYLPRFKQAGVKAVNNLRDGLQAGRSVIQATGVAMGLAFATGIESKASAAKTAGGTLGQKAIDGAKDKIGSDTSSGPAYDLGKNFGEGLINGLDSKADSLYAAGQRAGNHMKDGYKSITLTESPSRVAIQYGGYFGEGLVIGLDSFGTKVYSAAHDLGSAAVEALKSPLAIVQDILNGELEVDPTIRPVMDLSEIQNGVGLINGMSPQMSIGVNSISASMNRPKVSPSEEMISELRLLGERMNQPTNVYNVNGITYDDGSNISDAVRGLIAAARVERRR